MGDEGPIYFWKEGDPEWGWLSQWYASPFHGEDESIIYQHAEQYMMHLKALHFSDQATAREIMLTPSPRKCKALGRSTSNFSASIWDADKLHVVTSVSYHKFKHSIATLDSEALKRKLLATGKRELVEASPFDRVWGVGFTPEQLRLGRKKGFGRERWGENLLGKALMAARERIRGEEEEDGEGIGKDGEGGGKLVRKEFD